MTSIHPIHLWAARAPPTHTTYDPSRGAGITYLYHMVCYVLNGIRNACVVGLSKNLACYAKSRAYGGLLSPKYLSRYVSTTGVLPFWCVRIRMCPVVRQDLSGLIFERFWPVYHQKGQDKTWEGRADRGVSQWTMRWLRIKRCWGWGIMGNLETPVQGVCLSRRRGKKN